MSNQSCVADLSSIARGSLPVFHFSMRFSASWIARTSGLNLHLIESQIQNQLTPNDPV